MNHKCNSVCFSLLTRHSLTSGSLIYRILTWILQWILTLTTISLEATIYQLMSYAVQNSIRLERNVRSESVDKAREDNHVTKVQSNYDGNSCYKGKCTYLLQEADSAQ